MDIVVTTEVTPTFALSDRSATTLPLLRSRLLLLKALLVHGAPLLFPLLRWYYYLYIYPDHAGQCATTATMDIVVTPEITPTFAQIGPLCQNSTAPSAPG